MSSGLMEARILDEYAMRRDFTCNALYYDPIKEEIWDFHQGVADVASVRILEVT